MLREVIGILTIERPDARDRCPQALFAPSEAEPNLCTARSTFTRQTSPLGS